MTTKTKTTSMSDELIQDNVQAELRWDARVRPTEIGIAVKDGVVTLSGTVDSYPMRWAAEEAAQRVYGVRAVANDIELKLPTDLVRTDSDIAAAAARAIEWDTTLPTGTIEVTVSDGIVSLDGDVDWQFQRDDAERFVRRLAGVRGVVNLLRVKPAAAPEKPKAADVKTEIEDALVRNAEIDADSITVQTRGNTAILKGRVRSWAERGEAESAAWFAPGVQSVENQITIAP